MSGLELIRLFSWLKEFCSFNKNPVKRGALSGQQLGLFVSITKAMYLKKITALICLLYAFNLNAQQNKIDSIDKVLKGKLAAPERAIAMRNLAVAYYEITDFKKAIELYNQALAFSAKHRLDYESAAIYQNKSFVYGAMGEYNQAIKVLDSALVFANKDPL